jgi:hypothetical protein
MSKKFALFLSGVFGVFIFSILFLSPNPASAACTLGTFCVQPPGVQLFPNATTTVTGATAPASITFYYQAIPSGATLGGGWQSNLNSGQPGYLNLTGPLSAGSVTFTAPNTGGTWSYAYCSNACAIFAFTVAAAVPPINGACGTANGKTYPSGTTAYAPDTQCSSGTSTNTAFPTIGGSVSWNCNGSNGGTNASCSASRSAGSYDLTITDFHLTDVSGTTKATFLPGEAIYPFVTVKNEGTTSTPWGFYISIYSNQSSAVAEDTPSDVGVWVSEETGGIAPGATRTYSRTDNIGTWTNNGQPATSWTKSSTGSYTARAFVDSFGNTPESNEGNNQSTSGYTIGSAPQPDLTASGPTQNTATTNVAQTFTSTITNNGTASTGVGFTNLFQTSPVSDGSSGVIDYPVAGMGALAASGGNAVITKSLTFSSPGIIYVRACADKSSAADVNGVIAEGVPGGANENNNCSGSWTSVNVTNAPTISVSLNAMPNSMTLPANSTTLSWLTTGSPTNCTASGGWSGSKATGGSSEIMTGLTSGIHTYNITCTKASLPDATSMATVSVTAAAVTPTLTATPTSIYTGGSTVLQWSAPGATICNGTNFNTNGNTSGTVTSFPTVTTTYSISCDGGSPVSVTVTVKKRPGFDEI